MVEIAPPAIVGGVFSGWVEIHTQYFQLIRNFKLATIIDVTIVSFDIYLRCYCLAFSIFSNFKYLFSKSIIHLSEQ